MRRWLCRVLVLLCLPALAGCAADPAESSSPVSQLPTQQQGTPSGSPAAFVLPYNRDDTFNPYTTKTEANLALSTLLYDSLTVIGSDFTPQNSLADSVTQTDATHLTVTLRKNARFSDGSAVTPADVVASFNSARASSHYQALLSCFTAAAANKKSNTIVFTLGATVPQPAAALSFPVLKAASATNEKSKAPIGGGMYTVREQEDGVRLEYNAHSDKKPQYTAVGLRHLPNSDTMYYGLTSGSITYYFDDLNSGEVPRVSGANAVVDMNALLFLGINGAHEGVSDPRVRQAISLLIDRKQMASSACSGWVKAATGPFHPAWKAGGDSSGLTVTRDLVGAVELLESAGYGSAAGQKKLKLELIYSKDNASRAAVAEAVRSALEGVGIEMTVTPLAYNDYLSRLKDGRYALYLGDIRLPATMDLAYLFHGGSAGYGVPDGSPAAAAYAAYLAGNTTAEDFCAAFIKDLPYIPLCWRCGYAGYDRRLSVITPHGYDAYYGFENWK